MTKEIILLLTAATLAFDASPVAAQATDTLSRARVLMERAEELHRENRTKAALSLYTQAVDVMEAEHELPLVALRRIATIHLAAGRTRDAAAAMDLLAERATALGFVDAQANALLEAATLYYQIGARRAAIDRVGRLQMLLGSPHIEHDTVTRIRSRLVSRTAAR